MSEAHPETGEKPVAPRSVFRKAMDILIYPLAAIPAFLYAPMAIKRERKKRFEELGFPADYINKDGADLATNLKVWGEELPPEQKGAEILAEITRTSDRKFEEYLERKNMPGLYNGFKTLHSHQKWQIALESLGIASVTLGTLFSVFQNWELNHRLAQMEKEKEQREGKHIG